MFRNLKSLEFLYLDSNRLDLIINEILLNDLVNLKHLYLSDNRIEFIAENSFSKLSKLTNLELDNNTISLIDPSWLNEKPYLKKLNFCFNKNSLNTSKACSTKDTTIADLLNKVKNAYSNLTTCIIFYLIS